MTKHVHIVCLDAPSPPNYGGAIDMYYKIIALAEAGCGIKLHYFNYKKERNHQGLQAYCDEIHSYSRSGVTPAMLKQPYIVASRVNKQLIERLNADDAPVLLEGLHCAGIIGQLEHRKRVLLRMHNEESTYYRQLAASESNWLKRLYFQRESKLLANFQLKLSTDIKTICLSTKDVDVMRNKYGFTDVQFIPCFIPWQTVVSKGGVGSFCLYHGNMSVSENESAALWLIKEVFSKLPYPLKIAGSGISRRLQKAAAQLANIEMINCPGIEELDLLIRNAHVNVLPSVNATGVKLKLLHALFEGRFVLTNQNGVEGSGLEALVEIAEQPKEFRTHIDRLMNTPFTTADAKKRDVSLFNYNNLENAKKIIEQL